ncbi:prephenate dehydratase domain-containing protein [Vibrio gazogenes]|uniref:prephenate dehydratase n=1 Tax=Vibrio gazogenes DSM 21264 = NBRC 103151 TaxID=1123492 RepID=A0A1M4V703_VIBGA|nr:prephenate dehydratase domain-containing protein [Vibrio gazogenes]USP15608.1 ACT domain-containing protein [Vibrio gazogenes]SHE64643.1 prephenate dehydratase [Vibrio gazogenes DSM 21264] [Vibrio gazogenes DSM 21264 = NBRC 103151]SJN54620.1 Prephenate dehydratase [Vibrio gazogenes]
MRKIATLGPQGTFSETATRRYIVGLSASATDTPPLPSELVYFPTIERALDAIGSDCDVGVLPIENFSEGFIPSVLDQLIHADLKVIGEVILPIRFSCVGTAAFADVQQLFVQFVAKGQCSRFIELLGHCQIVLTESNTESLALACQASQPSAAIVPAESVQQEAFAAVVENVNDYENNQTRFLVFAAQHYPETYDPEAAYKTSLIVVDEHDHPGFLGEILTSFSRRKINLTSIISRPTCTQFGKYYFFIDLDGHLRDPAVAAALNEIEAISKVKRLGAYLKADTNV